MKLLFNFFLQFIDRVAHFRGFFIFFTLDKLFKLFLIIFYDLLKIKKEAPLMVKICSGGNCAVGNAFKVIQAVERYLGVKVGDDFNPQKRIEIVSCLGRCGEGPIVIINDKIFEKVTPNNIEDIFKGFV